LKKIFFYIVVAIALILAIDVISKLIYDIDRLTKYGWGHITGKVILSLIFSIIGFILYKKTFKNTLKK